jgi:hypothetical protein
MFIVSSLLIDDGSADQGHDAPWHFLYLVPLPQGQRSLRPIFRPPAAASNFLSPTRASWQLAHVHAGG